MAGRASLPSNAVRSDLMETTFGIVPPDGGRYRPEKSMGEMAKCRTG